MKKILVLFSLFAGISAYAADSGPYIGVGLGANVNNYKSPSDMGSVDMGRNIVGDIFFGYNFNKYIGTGVDVIMTNMAGFSGGPYSDDGVTTTSATINSNLSYTAIGWSVVGYIPAYVRNLKLYGKLGLSYNMQGINSSIIQNEGDYLEINDNSYTRSLSLLYGAGVEYDIYNTVLMRVGYQNNGSSSLGSDYGYFNLGTVMFSLGIKF